MIRDDLFSFAFIKKSPFHGSYQGMRYRIGKEKAGETDRLVAYVYPEPYCFEAAADDVKKSMDFDFTADGYEEAKNWLEEMYAAGDWKHA